MLAAPTHVPPASRWNRAAVSLSKGLRPAREPADLQKSFTSINESHPNILGTRFAAFSAKLAPAFRGNWSKMPTHRKDATEIPLGGAGNPQIFSRENMPQSVQRYGSKSLILVAREGIEPPTRGFSGGFHPNRAQPPAT